jgi:hypothetical protein
MSVTATRPRPAFEIPIGLAPKLLGGDAENWYEQLIFEDAPPSAQKFWVWLNKHGRYRTGDQMHRYAFGNVAEIAAEIGVASPTIRCYAIPWLVEHGWMSVQEVEVRGRTHSLWWCHWLLPFDPKGCTVDLGLGFMAPCDPPPSTRRGAENGARSAVFGAKKAPKTAPTNPDGLEERKQKTTTDAREVVVQASLGGEGEEARHPGAGPETRPEPTHVDQPPAAPSPSPSPMLDPEIARTMERHCPDPSFRAEVEELVPSWSAKMRREWLRKQGRKINDLAAYAEGIFRPWKLAGRCILTGIKEAAAPMPNQPSAAQEAARKAERAERDARDRDVRGRRDALSEDDRAALQARFEAEHPLHPSLSRADRQAQAPLRKLEWLAWLDGELERREVAP